MTFLPIVGRELRVAARRRMTYWGRFSAAAFALLIFGAVQTLFLVNTGRAPFSAGWIQFQYMKWLCFGVASLAGLFLTADTLSEEKREGTLGLLFLTDLRGYDVVLGKLISNSTQAFYGLLAAFPILGISLLMGGVSGGEFGRTMLVICNTLFLSLSFGLLVSSLSRNALKALNGTLLFILLLTVGLLLVDLARAGWDFMKFKPMFSIASPAYLLSTTSGYPVKDWWTHLGLQHVLGWVLLVLSSVCIPRAWQEKATKTSASGTTLGHRWRFGGQRARVRRRRSLLARNPILWLATRDRWLPRVVWAGTFLCLGLFAWRTIYYSDHQTPRWFFLEGMFQLLVRLVFFLWVASQAGRFFVEAARNGALELILVTPATPAQIVKGQWRALCRIFLIPGLLLLAISVAGDLIQFREMLKSIRGASGNFNFVESQIVGMVSGILTYAANLLAVAWFGMWMGMTTRKPSMAVLKTLCFVVVLPSVALLFIRGATMFLLTRFSWRGAMPFWMAGVVVTVFNLGKNLFFIFWSRRRLATRFRQQAAQEGRVSKYRLAPPLPPLPPIAPPTMQQPSPPPVPVVLK